MKITNKEVTLKLNVKIKLLSLIFISMNNISYANINYRPHFHAPLSIEEIIEEQRYNKYYYEKNENVDLFSQQTNPNQLINEIFEPIISSYLIGFIGKMQRDSEVMSAYCDISLETKEKQQNFIKCFNQEKHRFSNDIFVHSMELSTSFLQIKKIEEIRNNFINSFKKELDYIKITYSGSELLYVAFEKILIDLFSNILLESYEKNLFIAQEYDINDQKVDLFFSELATKLNDQLRVKIR